MKIETNNTEDFADMPPELKAEMQVVSKSRRDFMKVTGMAAMGAVIAGCTAEARHVKPLIAKPEGINPGVVYHYASTCQGCSAACATLMKVRDGRPIKLEGDGAGLCAKGQAQLWTLYNPARLHGPVSKEDGKVEWKDIDAAVSRMIGAGTVLLTGSISGPTGRDVINRFKAKGGRHVAYDAISAHAISKAHKATHDAAVIPTYNFAEATVVVSFDADFLGAWLDPVHHARDWATQRDLKFGRDRMSRLLSFEARMSLTGANADERFRIADRERGAVLADLARRLGGNFGEPGKHSVEPAVLEKLAAELKAAGRRALVVTGSRDVKHQIVANWINNQLGAYGTTISLNRPTNTKLGNDDELAQLIKDMESGSVKSLIVWGVNPVYDLPDSAKFKEAMAKVTNTVAISSHADETASECQWIAAEDDPLETWNDFEPVRGTFRLAQPGIRRLWDTRNGFTSLLKWIGDAEGGRDYRLVIRAYWEANILRGSSWESAVEIGSFSGFGLGGDGQPAAFNAASVSQAAGVNAVAAEGFEIVPFESYNLGDGRHAVNGWLLEMGDPLVRTTWTNLALMSPYTMEAQGFKEGDIVEIKADVNGRSATCKVPVCRAPGMAEGVVAISTGYGRTHAGPIVHGRGTEEDAVDPDLLKDGVHSIGGNAFPFMADVPVNGSVTKTGRRIKLAKISEHDSQEGRPILKQTSLEMWLKDKRSGNKDEIPNPDITLWPKWEYKGHKWGMVIDLNACIGCNACQIACNIENNVPVVGKEEVWRRREMHWIRIDTYYEDNDGSMFDGEQTKDENPEVGFQPMMCQHCENAPCETVCPVIATSHSDEGLNVQAYNRCIGTRYCANNCPYKVRRFNWFRYEHHNLTMNLVLNPDVTVRSRGVMEKCSMCAQRIYDGKREAALHNVPVKDGAIVPACAQTCPTQAIMFGDQNDQESKVAKLLTDPRNYAVLAEINTRPAVTYLTKVRNRPTKDYEKPKEKKPH